MVGRHPDPVLGCFVNDQDVSLAADVESVVPYYAQAAATVTPLFLGGGTRLKILESFACRRPVISTTIGAEGLAVAPEKDCLIADEPESFADACVRVLRDFDLAKRLGEGGYDFVRGSYDLAIVKAKIAALMDDMGAERQ
jgi:glycosyltransferase involved in cell wall biosynthesis